MACWKSFWLTLATIGLTWITTVYGWDPARTEWYRQSLVNVHFDNHSCLLGHEQTPAELEAMLSQLQCTMIQVSAQSSGTATYPTAVALVHPQDPNYDTLAVFARIARAQNKKFCIYMSSCLRERELKEHPQWNLIGPDGKPAGSRPGQTMCQRPNRARRGYLYERFLPQIEEIIRKYDPDGFWFDGDYVYERQACWCPNCLAEWKADTGLDAPRDERSPHWARWNAWSRARHREYLRVTGQAIHAASPKAIYTTNWSWAWNPEPVLHEADTLSGDAWSIQQVHSAVQRWGAQRTPWDIMSFCAPESRSMVRGGHRFAYSLQRTLQEGALTMASGGVWFLWPFGPAVTTYGIDTTRSLIAYLRDRQPAIGPSESCAQVAVLDSETSFAQGGESGILSAAHQVARSLAESGYLTDVVNEQTFGESAARYAVVVVPGHRFLAPSTVAALRALATRGGLVLFTAGSLAGDEGNRGNVAQLLGLKQLPAPAKEPAAALLNGRRFHWMNVERLEPGTAKIVLKTVDGRPLITTKAVGQGAIAYLGATCPRYPDEGQTAGLLKLLGRGPSYQVVNCEAAVLCMVRRRPGQLVLHAIDLSARVSGAPADVDTPDYTDFNRPLRPLSITLPLPIEPRAVRAVPVGTVVKSKYADGRLQLTFNAVATHAAAILDVDAPGPLPLMSPTTPTAENRFHPLSSKTGMLLSDSFEEFPSGREPAGGWKPMVRDNTAIRVVDRPAAHGRKCLEFVEAEGSSFWPFLYHMLPAVTRGRSQLAFDLNLEPGQSCNVEVRHEGRGSGPTVRFDSQGNVFADSQRLGSVVPNTWNHVEIQYTLGTDRPGYRVKITAPGRPTIESAELPYRNPWFYLANAVYFVGNGQKAGRFWLDNVCVERLTAE
jgi:hypothetical protein